MFNSFTQQQLKSDGNKNEIIHFSVVLNDTHTHYNAISYIIIFFFYTQLPQQNEFFKQLKLQITMKKNMTCSSSKNNRIIFSQIFMEKFLDTNKTNITSKK